MKIRLEQQAKALKSYLILAPTFQRRKFYAVEVYVLRYAAFVIFSPNLCSIPFSIKTDQGSLNQIFP